MGCAAQDRPGVFARAKHALLVRYLPNDMKKAAAARLARLSSDTGKDAYDRIAERRHAQRRVKTIVIDSGRRNNIASNAQNTRPKSWSPAAVPHAGDTVRKTIRIDSYRPLTQPLQKTEPTALQKFAGRIERAEFGKRSRSAMTGVGRTGARQLPKLAAFASGVAINSGRGAAFGGRTLWHGLLGLGRGFADLLGLLWLGVLGLGRGVLAVFGLLWLALLGIGRGLAFAAAGIWHGVVKLAGGASLAGKATGRGAHQTWQWARGIRAPRMRLPKVPVGSVARAAPAGKRTAASFSLPKAPSLPKIGLPKVAGIKRPSFAFPTVKPFGLARRDVNATASKPGDKPTIRRRERPAETEAPPRISDPETTAGSQKSTGRLGPALTYLWLVLTTPPEPKRKKVKAKWRPHVPLLSPSMNLAVIGGLGVIALTVKSLPSPATLYPIERTLEVKTDRQLLIHTSGGDLFARRGGCVEAPVSLNELPKHTVDALIAMEDRRFYYHYGVDPKGIMRAAKRNIDARRVVEGGSTITQQLAKISYLSRDRTFDRKLQELLIVLRLELMLTKRQILERYFSMAYFGSGCHGLRAAARHYFGKPVSKLSVGESAYLVALLRSPSKLVRNPKKAIERQQLVLNSMVETGSLTAAARAKVPPIKIQAEKPDDFGAYYADWIEQTIQLPDDGKSTPLKVQTSFDPKMQRLADKTLKDVLVRWGGRVKASQMALVAMRPDGRVLAMVGGRDYGKSQFNRAFQAMRQPGSAFKTFVYMAALRKGAQPNMLVADQPLTIGEWSPQNFGLNFRGTVSLQQAFASSINTVAVRLSEATGRDDVITAAHDLGIQTKLNSNPSIALGTSEVNLVELTSAYAAIAANAYPVRPWGVTAFASDDAKKATPPKGAGEWKLMVGDQLRTMLGTVVSHGTARGARLPIPAYGKTGTSQDFRDAWFVGFAGNLVVGVWFGNDDNSSMSRVTGGSLPASAWRYFMTLARASDKKFRTKPGKIAAFPAKTRKLDAKPSQEFASLLTTPETKRKRARRSLAGDPRFGDGFYYGGRYYRYQQVPPQQYRRYAPPQRSYRRYRRYRRSYWSDGGA